jgi:hypothetical protein
MPFTSTTSSTTPPVSASAAAAAKPKSRRAISWAEGIVHSCQLCINVAFLITCISLPMESAYYLWIITISSALHFVAPELNLLAVALNVPREIFIGVVAAWALTIIWHTMTAFSLFLMIMMCKGDCTCDLNCQDETTYNGPSNRFISLFVFSLMLILTDFIGLIMAILQTLLVWNKATKRSQ